jgi:hypothetical protein
MSCFQIVLHEVDKSLKVGLELFNVIVTGAFDLWVRKEENEMQGNLKRSCDDSPTKVQRHSHTDRRFADHARS